MRQSLRPTCPRTDKKRISKVRLVSLIVLIVVSFLWVLPLLWMVGTSLKTDLEVATKPTSLFPTMGFNFSHYINFFKYTSEAYSGSTGYFNIMAWFRNSTIVAIVSVCLNLTVFTLAAYGFVFIDFKYKKFAWAIILGSLTIPGIATYVAKYSMLMSVGKSLDLLRNPAYLYSCIILPGTCGVFNLFLVRQFFLSIPKDLIESGKIDGLTNMQIFTRIVLPLSRSVLFVTGMFTFIGAWNGYEWPMLILAGQPEELGLLTPGLAAWATGGSTVNMGRTLAAATISTIPIIIVYIFAQNKVIDGIASTGVKG